MVDLPLADREAKEAAFNAWFARLNAHMEKRGLSRVYDIETDRFVFCPKPLADRAEEALNAWVETTGETLGSGRLRRDMGNQLLHAIAIEAHEKARAAYQPIPKEMLFG